MESLLIKDERDRENIYVAACVNRLWILKSYSVELKLLHCEIHSAIAGQEDCPRLIGGHH